MLTSEKIPHVDQVRIRCVLRYRSERILVQIEDKFAIAVVRKRVIFKRMIFLSAFDHLPHDAVRWIFSSHDDHFFHQHDLRRHANFCPDQIRHNHRRITITGVAQSHGFYTRRNREHPVQITQKRRTEIGVNLHKRNRMIGTVFHNLKRLLSISKIGKKCNGKK